MNIIYCQIGLLQHPVLIPTSAIFNAYRPFSSLPNTLHPPSVCSLYLRVSCGLPPSLSVCNYFSPLPFPHCLLLSFSRSTYEWKHISVLLWLTYFTQHNPFRYVLMWVAISLEQLYENTQFFITIHEAFSRIILCLRKWSQVVPWTLMAPKGNQEDHAAEALWRNVPIAP